jgi:hypothetical protein
MVFAHQNTDFEVDIRHESTHALLHASLPMVPLWLDEGLAEYFEVPADQRLFEHSHLAKVRWAARFGQIPSLEGLEEIRSLRQMGQAQYRSSWAWVHFMLHGPPEARRQLLDFLADIQAHVPPGRLSQRLHGRIPALERQFAEHFQSWRR